MMPSPSTGKLTAAVAAAATAMYRGHGNADYRDGGGGAGGGGNGGGVPAEKEQLRRNLSLLKKKMHGQGGSRRSQVCFVCFCARVCVFLSFVPAPVFVFRCVLHGFEV